MSSAAKVSALLGTTRVLDASATSREVVTAEDVQDPKKLAELLGRLLTATTELRRRWAPKRIDFEDVAVGGQGASVRLAHHFGGRARWSVVGWQADTSRSPWDDALWVHRAFFGPDTLTSGAANSSVGCRFQVSSKTRVAGARFAWRSSGGSKTIKASLWRDGDGARLASGTTTVSNSGAYVVAFDTPVILDGSNLNSDLTISIYDTAGVNYSYTGASTPFRALLSLQMPGVLLKAINLAGTGDVRPTLVDGTEDFWVEPFLATPHPALVEDTAATDTDTLVLKSYAPGVVSVRTEEAG